MKYVKRYFFFSLLSIMFLNGCGNEKKEEKTRTFKTVNYYDNHISERDARIKECLTMKEMTETVRTDCANANESRANEKRGIPIGL